MSAVPSQICFPHNKHVKCVLTSKGMGYNNYMYHGIILDLEFFDIAYPETLEYFAKRKSKTNPWTLYGISIKSEDIDRTVSIIQQNMKSDKHYYAHFYNDEELIVVFKNKVFKVKPHISTWKPIIEHGASLKIPEEQLDFWPNRFQDEIHYFNKEDFIK